MSRPAHLSLRAWALGISLIVAVASIAVLAHQSVILDRSHRAVAEGVARDYSAFAADQFSRLAAERLTALTRTILEPVACRSSAKARLAAAVDRTAAAALPAASSCVNANAVEGFFEADPETGLLAFTTGGIGQDIREAVANLPAEDPFGFVLVSGHGPPRLMGYWTGLVPGSSNHVVGFVAPLAIVQPVFDGIVERERLLPGALTDPARNREYLSIDVRDASGRPVFRSGENITAYATDRMVGSAGSNMRLRLSINEAAAGRLIIGGVPRSRLPLLLTLLTLAVGLLAIGTWQAQREHRLARMRVDFVRSASHELRTPLAQIRLFTETLQLGRVRSWAEVQQSLALVDQQSQRLSRLVENLLTFTHGGQQRQARLEPIELGAFLSETRVGFQPIAEALGQQLRLEPCEPCCVRGDPLPTENDWRSGQ